MDICSRKKRKEKKRKEKKSKERISCHPWCRRQDDATIVPTNGNFTRVLNAKTFLLPTHTLPGKRLGNLM